MRDEKLIKKRSGYTYYVDTEKPVKDVKKHLEAKEIDYDLRGKNFFVDQEVAQAKFGDLLEVMV